MRDNTTKSLQVFGKRGVEEHSKTGPIALHGSKMALEP